jgi:hypothetical protein
MQIPKVWTKASATERLPDGRSFPVSVWGWGEDEATARYTAAERLQRVLERLRKGERFPDRYTYGKRPLREEILRIIQSESGDGLAAILTRNSYGAEVLNTARLLFLDVDVPEASLSGKVRRLFGGASPDEDALSTLRQALREYGLATFRIYRTASGFRVMAVDREFNPTAPDTHDLMKKTGTDPAFSQLCLVQRSFRARLTPKPWRSRLQNPPGEYPRQEGDVQHSFETWLADYQRRAAGFATCRYLETVGNGTAAGDLRMLQGLHDRATRCDETLPLA